MPIHDMRFENGIFYARESGKVSESDAELWAKHMRSYSNTSEMPIVSVVDAREVTYITVEAKRVFVLASRNPNLLGACVVTNNFANTQSARVIGMMVEPGHTHVFATLEEAQVFALRLLKAAFTG